MPMTQRAAAVKGFNDLVCDVAVPASAKNLRVEQHILPAPASKVNTVVVFGDTGCRIKGFVIQQCNDPKAWPFPLITHTVAALHPDLIVHVGDYLYRETACPPFDAGCAGSPSGDTSPAWYADWFTPAAPLFSSAPLVLARGNHEDCPRSGEGWFRYLDPHPTTACEDVTQPYAVALPGLRLVVFDSASGEDQRPDDALIARFKTAFDTARSLASTPASGPTWLVTHRPPYLNANERAAMGDLRPFSALLAGHVHLFGGINVAGLPPLIINGEGGDRLDAELGPLLRYALGNLHIVGTPFVTSHFGFGVYTRTRNGWSVSLRDPDGSIRASCSLEKGSVQCGSE
jgi:hypothetical protein